MKSDTEPQIGDRKIEQFFAWLPVVVGFRFRWLCTVRIQYVYVDDDDTDVVGPTRMWVAERYLPVE